MARMLEIMTKLGADTFVVQRFSGREELGRMFDYRVELLSERSDIKAEDLLGSNATVAMEMTDGLSQRYFNGYITRFSVQGEVPNPLAPPAGCAFNPRCPHANERCRAERPALLEIAGVRVACHAVEEGRI